MIDRDVVMSVVEPLFEQNPCVSRDDILARIDASPRIEDGDKRILGSLWKDDCYTRESFRNALEAYGWLSPISYGSNLGGF